MAAPEQTSVYVVGTGGDVLAQTTVDGSSEGMRRLRATGKHGTAVVAEYDSRMRLGQSSWKRGRVRQQRNTVEAPPHSQTFRKISFGFGPEGWRDYTWAPEPEYIGIV